MKLNQSLSSKNDHWWSKNFDLGFKDPKLLIKSTQSALQMKYFQSQRLM